MVVLCSRAISNRPFGRVLAFSTPASGDRGFSLVFRQCERAGLRLHYHVRCPHCGELDTLVWERMVWDSQDDPEAAAATVRYPCKTCQKSWRYDALRQAIDGGRWQALPDDSHAGAHVSGTELLGAGGDPIRWPRRVAFRNIWFGFSIWRSWEDNVADWLMDQGDHEAVTAFIQLRLGRPSKHDLVEVRSDEFKRLQDVPESMLMIAASIDVQGNRLSVAVFAVARDESAVLLERTELHGATSVAHQGAWLALEDWVRAKPMWRRSDGRWMPLDVIVIDSGKPQTVVFRALAYLPVLSPANVYAIKGYSGKTAPDAKGKPTPVPIDGRECRQYPLNVDELKMEVMRRLQSGKLAVASTVSEAVVAELTNERAVLIGEAVKWRKITPRAPNEALDQAVYLLGLLRIAPPQWPAFETALARRQQPSDVAPNATPAVTAPKPNPPAQRQPRQTKHCLLYTSDAADE